MRVFSALLTDEFWRAHLRRKTGYCYGSSVYVYCTDTNAQIKVKFKALHSELVKLNVTSVCDELFSKDVISDHDYQELVKITDQSAKSRSLLALLHKSSHPAAFIKLREALAGEDVSLWLVEHLDQMITDEPARSSQQSEDPRPLRCGRHSVFIVLV